MENQLLRCFISLVSSASLLAARHNRCLPAVSDVKCLRENFTKIFTENLLKMSSKISRNLGKIS